MSQVRPSSQTMLSIESQRLDDVFRPRPTDMIIETFADNKARNKTL